MSHRRTKKIILRMAVIIICLYISACSCLTRGPQEVDNEIKANCYTCALFNITYGAGSKLAAQVYKNVLPSASNFLAWGFMIWMSMEIVKFVSSVKAPKVGQFWSSIFFKFLICLVCILIIRTPTSMVWFVNAVINPIFIGFIEFADAVLTGSGNCGFAAAQSAQSTPESVMSSEPRVALSCLIGQLHVKLSFGKSLGRALACHTDSTLAMRLIGILFIAAFAAIGVIFPFYIIDSIIRLGLAFALLPVFIMAFPFESTKKITHKGLILFLDAGMTISIISICMTLVTGVTRVFLETNYPFILASSVDNIEDFAGPGVGTLTLLFLVMLVFSSVSISASVAQGIVGSSIPNGVVSSAMKAAKMLFKIIAIVGGPLGKAVSKVGNKVTDKMSDNMGDGNG